MSIGRNCFELRKRAKKRILIEGYLFFIAELGFYGQILL